MSDKICRLCGKDVSSMDRIKDAKGNYYCEPCHAAAVKKMGAARPVGAGVQSASAPVAAASASDDGEYDLHPVAAPQPTKRPQPVATVVEDAPAKAPASSVLPKNCPGCGAVMLAGRKVCIKCNRDVTKMDKLLAHRAASDKGPAREEVVGNLLGRAIRFVVIAVCIGAVVLIGYGVWMVFHPGKPFEEYPTTRAEAIHEFLGYIQKGTAKSYDNALALISLREKASHNPDELGLYRLKFAGMHDDFQKKYGSDWLSRVKIKPPEVAGESGFGFDEETPIEVSIDKDTFVISTQVQIPADDATMNMLQRNNNKTYPEDGKNRFGILDVEGYSVRDTRHHTPFGPS